MPRPNFEGVPLFRNAKDKYIIGTADSDNDSAHKQDLDCESMSPVHYTFQIISVTQEFSCKILIACDKP